MRKSSYEKLREAKRRERAAGQEFTYDGVMKLLLDGFRPPEERQVNPTQLAFINDTSLARVYKGPAGCAKTSTLCALVWLRCLFVPGTRALVSRWDYNDLAGTTRERMWEMLERLPPGVLIQRSKAPPEEWRIRPIQYSADDEFKESVIKFMSGKDGFGSYEFDVAVFDEMDEYDVSRVRETLMRFRGRAGIELQKQGFEGAFCLAGAFNPPGKEHWLYTACTGRDHQERFIEDPWLKLFNPVATENQRNLPEDYYDAKKKKLSPDQVDRLIKGEWGSTFPGSPVYRQFRQDVHAARKLKYQPYQTLYRFWDFGYNHPCVLFAQLDFRSRLLFLHEFYDEKVEIRDFARQVKAFTAEKFGGHRDIVDIGDPAARQMKDTGSTVSHLSQEDIKLNWAIIEDFEASLRVCRNLFERFPDGEPAIQIDAENCPVLVSALKGGYHLEDKVKPGGSGELRPVKDGFYDHPADAFRYGVYFLFRGEGVDVKKWPSTLSMSAALKMRYGR